MLLNGYKSGMFDCQVKIPNTEIKGIYRLIIRSWLHTRGSYGRRCKYFRARLKGLADNLQNIKNQYSSALFSGKKIPGGSVS
jgi:hypothetical protein